MSLHRIFWVLLLGVATSAAAAAAESAENVKRAREHVQGALAAEAAGDQVERARLLLQASLAAPDEPAVRWQLGQVRSGTAWQDYETLATEARDSAVLQEYRKKRDTSDPNVPSQKELALFCMRNKLPQQAAVHWSAVLELDPENLDARKHLGFEKLRGRWVNRSDLAAEKEQAAKVAEALRRLTRTLQGVAAQLKAGTLSVEQGTEQLSAHAEPAAIPAWESLVSSKSSEGSLAVVGALGGMQHPAASASLTRHALASQWLPVRLEASRFLKDRDENSYVPALLAELRGPWIGWREMATDGRNQLVYRYSLVADGQDQQTLRVLDEAYFLHGVRAMAAGLAQQSTNMTALQLERLREQENLRINANNERVMQLLSHLTGEFVFDSPQDWWQWWDERNEVYLAEGKLIDTSYAFRSTGVVGLPPPLPPVGSGGGGGRETSTKKDCLAGGTLILTQRGPVAVERVRIGDLVVARHPETGEVALQPVLRTTVREPQPLISITLGEATLRASGGHPFWVSGKGWTRARELKPGMVLHGLTQGTKVTDVQVQEKATRSFNLVVANFHSYFVEPGILSHDNSAIEPTSSTVPGLTK